jgi:hypothetical protein
MGYPSESSDRRLLDSLFSGQYAWQFWTMAVVGLFVPAILLSLPWTRTFKGILTAAILINVGMWLKRYVIVVPTLSAPFMPIVTETGQPISYVPTWVEWSITAAAFAGFSMLYLLFAKVFPIVSIWEIESGQREEREEAEAVLKEAGVTISARPALANVRSLLLMALAGALLIAATSSTTSAAPATQPAATSPVTTQPATTIQLSVVTEDGQKLVKATVLAGEKPVENAVVQFSVQRTFGNLKLGEDKTLDDGTAAVKFPVTLPGNASGELVLVGEVTAPPAIAGICTEMTSTGGVMAKAPEEDAFPRALWAPRAPVVLLVVLAVMFGGVWITYVFVVAQIVAIKRGARP